MQDVLVMQVRWSSAAVGGRGARRGEGSVEMGTGDCLHMLVFLQLRGFFGNEGYDVM